jgi:hypothetical protein
MTPPSNVERSIGRLEGKLDSLIDLLTNQNRDIQAIHLRVDALEKGKSWAIGAASGGFAVISTLLVVVWRILGLME